MALGILLLLIWLILLIRFPRIMVPASVGVVAVALILASLAATWQWFSQRQINDLRFDFQYAADSCPANRPLQLVISNHGQRTVSNISWQLVASPAGMNSNMLDVGGAGASYRHAGPLASGDSWQQCYALPRLRSGFRAAELNYRAEHVRADVD